LPNLQIDKRIAQLRLARLSKRIISLATRLMFPLGLLVGLLALFVFTTTDRIPLGRYLAAAPASDKLVLILAFAAPVAAIVISYLFRQMTTFLYDDRDHRDRSITRASPLSSQADIVASVVHELERNYPLSELQNVTTGISGISDAAKSRIALEAIGDIERRFATTIRSEFIFKSTADRLDRLSQTLARQLDLQDRKATINLFIGMIIAVAGFALLGWLTLSGYMSYKPIAGAADFWLFGEWYIPKLTFVIIIEIFSYFFLSLYRAGLGEIKFFQNEITNLESKWASIHFAIGANDGTATRVAIERLAQTERNFVLKKGERNVSEVADEIPTSKLADAVARVISAMPSAREHDGSKNRHRSADEHGGS
jgi:ABC-type multidrug transport system fused ATPase/permease subunit